MTLIPPHGLKLVDRRYRRNREFQDGPRTEPKKSVVLDRSLLQDLWLIGTGAYSPLTGFMSSKEYTEVLEHMHLPSGWPWTLPIVLDVDRAFARSLREGEWIALKTPRGTRVGYMQVREWFTWDPETHARAVFQTTSLRHPGVAALKARRDTFLAGPVYLTGRPGTGRYQQYLLEPRDTRRIFRSRRWRTVVAFQTRNPIHRAHEYIHRVCLEIFDGLFLHPLMGVTKPDDIPAPVRLRCYETLIRHYYPRNRVVLGVLLSPMRYAGPREAVHHAIVRKNYGATHFIVGRDHAGVGGFYHPQAARRIFKAFEPDRLGITPVFFDEVFYCRKCETHATARTCGHDAGYHLKLSGTEMRELLAAGHTPPPEITRPEVARILARAGLSGRLRSSTPSP